MERNTSDYRRRACLDGAWKGGAQAPAVQQLKPAAGLNRRVHGYLHVDTEGPPVTTASDVHPDVVEDVSKLYDAGPSAFNPHR